MEKFYIIQIDQGKKGFVRLEGSEFKAVPKLQNATGFRWKLYANLIAWFLRSGTTGEQYEVTWVEATKNKK